MRFTELLSKAQAEHRLHKTVFWHPELAEIAKRDSQENWGCEVPVLKSSEKFGHTAWIEIGLSTGCNRLGRLLNGRISLRSEPFSVSGERIDDDQWTQFAKPWSV